MNKQLAANLLNDIHKTLDTCGLGHFLIDGTLLGAIRERDFIEYDIDMDLGVYAEQWTRATVTHVLNSLENIKILAIHEYGDFDNYFEIALQRDDIKCDLFFYRREIDKRVFHAFKNGGRKLPDDVITYEYPAGLIENLSLINFQGDEYPIPSNPEEVLKTKYGQDWRTPIHIDNWDWRYGPHNVRK